MASKHVLIASRSVYSLCRDCVAVGVSSVQQKEMIMQCTIKLKNIELLLLLDCTEIQQKQVYLYAIYSCYNFIISFILQNQQ